MNGHGSYIWYELLTTDAAAAKRFYGEVVGWRYDGRGDDPHEYHHLTAPDGEQVGGIFQLTPEMQSGGARPIWLGYIAVGDVDATVASIEADGGRVMMPARDMENVGRMAMVTDPQGAPFNVMKPSPPPERAGKASTAFCGDEGAVGHCGWNELGTTDPEAALHFYARHVGMASNERMPMGEMGDYCFLEHHGVTLGAVMKQQGGRPSMWNYYFCVDSIERAKRAAEAGGGQIMMGPMEVPGGAWIIVGMDPQGAQFCCVGEKG